MNTKRNKKSLLADPAAQRRPDLYSFHDYLRFLNEWVNYRKATQRGFSLRSLAQKTGVAVGYLPMVLAGKRSLSNKALQKILPHLELNAQERKYFEALVQLGTADTQELRIEALDRMKRSHSYQQGNPKELEVHQYLTHWYYVVIRELAMLPDFKAEPEWIQAQLKHKVGLAEIKVALEFLINNNYITARGDGTYAPAQKALECVGGVYKVALTEFHQEMLDLAAKSITATPSDERNITSHTMVLSEKTFDQAREILGDALRRIQELEQKAQSGDPIYHVELALFPLTKRTKK